VFFESARRAGREREQKMSDDDKNVPWLEPANEDVAETSFLENYRMTIIAASIFVIVAFALIIWQVYSGGDSQGGGEVPLVKAEDGPLKVKPEQPGGMEIPDRDKLVYNSMAGNEADSEQAHLRPGPEALMDKPVEQAPEAQTTEGKPIQSQPAQGQPAQGQPAQGQPVQNHVAQNQANPAALPQAQVAEVHTPPAQKPGAEVPVAIKPQLSTTPAILTKPAEPSAAFNALTGDYLIQLGAFSSRERAMTAWTQIQGKFPKDLAKLQPNVITVDHGGSGVLYRLQAGKLADRGGADSLCKILSAKSQACIVVHR
jgi:hypothetical protein